MHTEQITMAEFLARHPVNLTWQTAPANPDMSDAAGMFHYYITLEYQGHSMSLYYSKGRGHVTPHPRMPAKDAALHIVNSRPRTLYGEELLKRFPYTPTPPTRAEVLDNLASEADGIESTRGFEDWAGEFGYDTDSRKALATYEACLKSARSLRDFLGRDAFYLLLHQVERL